MGQREIFDCCNFVAHESPLLVCLLSEWRHDSVWRVVKKGRGERGSTRVGPCSWSRPGILPLNRWKECCELAASQSLFTEPLCDCSFRLFFSSSFATLGCLLPSQRSWINSQDSSVGRSCLQSSRTCSSLSGTQSSTWATLQPSLRTTRQSIAPTTTESTAPSSLCIWRILLPRSIEPRLSTATISSTSTFTRSLRGSSGPTSKRRRSCTILIKSGKQAKVGRLELLLHLLLSYHGSPIQ